MSDVVMLARTARESLARGLNALQGDPNVPQPLLDLAAPIAQAMGALHQIERSGGAKLVPNAQNALATLQHALAQLQAQPTGHQVVLTAAEAVAGALGTVHALTRAAQAQAAQPKQQADVLAQPSSAPNQAAQPRSVQTRAAAPQAAAAVPSNPHLQPPRGAEGQAVTAELGTHSPTNFYKGLSGNDIVDHGGLFVSTYKLPKLGQPVRLRVSLPGGYEFEANGVVRWRREPSDAGSDAPPGFGAQFTEITSEARQLIYRYVRNREPMFHDDL